MGQSNLYGQHSDLQIGVFYFIVVVDFAIVGVALGGWGANTPESVSERRLPKAEVDLLLEIKGDGRMFHATRNIREV